VTSAAAQPHITAAGLIRNEQGHVLIVSHSYKAWLASDPANPGYRIRRKARRCAQNLPVGDDAFTFAGSEGGGGLSFLSGDTVSSIFSTVPTTTAGKIALAKSILEG
jgi:hypothetical protein